ncbi:unnamed protein product [Staurois parvus]|uniref:Olfactory receptor n=1 Tax=Staurois parvus TaxID=386267 RepID=A0ABN9FAK0_9NEOB|nr:unnamed protein product [Staurois parvus]
MNNANKTQVDVFELSGLTDDREFAPFLFIFFLLVYMITVCGNIGIIAVVQISPSLHTPMYYFLSYLSVVDLLYSSVVTPKMLSDLLSDKKFISFVGCALQFYFYVALAITESLLLSTMSYDRYVAICQPLCYVSIMTKKRCLNLILLVFKVGCLQSVVQTSCIFTLEYCGPNFINHFYCDGPPLFKLSCSDTFWCDLIAFFFVSSCGIGSMVTVLSSYSLIVASILRMKSAEGRQKAFSTCSSHIMCISIFYGTVFFIYLRPPTAAFDKKDKVASVFYTVMIPMLNPLIYSLRNQEVRKILRKTIHKSHQ